MKYRTHNRFQSFFHTLDIVRRVILGIIFWTFLIVLIIIAITLSPPKIKKNTVLKINPYGSLVDNYTSPMLYRGLPLGGYPNETRLDDLIFAINRAKTDSRITGIWLRLDDLSSAGAASAGELSEALKSFSESGKTLIASADTFGTAQYRLASSANHIVLDRLGEVFPSGYGIWRGYLADGLEKFGGRVNLFRSGEAKDAAENLIRNNMSETSRKNEANLLNSLWQEWIHNVALNRNISPEELEDWIENYDKYLIDANGNGSESARRASLIDEVETGGTLNTSLEMHFGEGFNLLEVTDYIARERKTREGKAVIAVIPITGPLVYGEGYAGMTGSDEIVAAIEEARSIPGLVSLVLRIDSPGGDVRSGELIRRSVQETREEWNLPVLASLGNLAASGGYWIALESDSIITRPETITGSIGVFAISIDFQKGLSEFLGITIDGLGTTPWSGMAHPGRSLNDRTASLYEAGVKDIDILFKNLVSEKRGIDMEKVETLAGGITWSGKQALELGLVDGLGGLQETINHAAELAGVESWQTLTFPQFQNPRHTVLGRIFWGQRGSNKGLLMLMQDFIWDVFS